MAKNKSNSIDITRIYDAPVKLVWDAWTDPKQTAKWWGPRGFTLTTHSKDLRPGGMWHYTMHGPDGTDYINKTIYFEVEKYSRLVYDHGGNDEQAPLFRVTVTFQELKGNKTQMNMSMVLPTPEAAEQTRKFIKQAGGNATWDRLAEFLDKESSGNESFVINRAFEAPLAQMFEMWTKPEHFSKWLPPTGFEMTYIKSDIREGETTLFMMSNADGFKMYSRAKYLEIKNPNRIVYAQEFCDEKGNVTKAPFEGAWPETMLITVTLTEEAPDQTRVTVKTDLYKNATPEEIQAFVNERAGMTQGWSGSFDKLENLLAKA
jgi:uncharacterized protein YndB with AHSA1/START domain